jgi:hypothetical protein
MPVLVKLRQEDCEFEASLDYTVFQKQQQKAYKIKPTKKAKPKKQGVDNADVFETWFSLCLPVSTLLCFSSVNCYYFMKSHIWLQGGGHTVTFLVEISRAVFKLATLLLQ